MEIPVIYIFTHDSIAVGEDGPTHQPIEHLASLRAIPGLITLRPADADEVVEAWKFIMQRRHEPVALILTRQAVPTLGPHEVRPGRWARSAAPMSWPMPPNGKPDVLLLATGSEVVALRGCRREAEGRRHRSPRRQHALVGDVRVSTAARIQAIASSPSLVGARRGSAWSWPRRLAGSGMSAPMAACSA